MYTEDQAREKWCPMARLVLVYPGEMDGCVTAANRGWADKSDHLYADTRCIASECMAFRWLPDADVQQDGLVLDHEDADLANGAWWSGKYWKRNEDYVHRIIVIRAFGSLPSGSFVDHIDGDPQNNRRGNLRIVDHAQNAANAASRGGKSKYRGVHQQASGRWTAQISKKGVRWCLGTYDTEEEAAAAYDEAAKAVHGEYARLNLEVVTNNGRRGYCGAFGKPS